MIRRFSVALGITCAALACLVLTGCGRHRDEPDAASPKPRLHDTVSDSRVGTRLTITASVLSVIGDRACVVGDADLPPAGLPAIGPVDVHPVDLVTIEGTVVVFDQDRFSSTFGITGVTTIRNFQGQKVLLIDRVHSWAVPQAHRSQMPHNDFKATVITVRADRRIARLSSRTRHPSAQLSQHPRAIMLKLFHQPEGADAKAARPLSA
jgi:hypothetical protein